MAYLKPPWFTTKVFNKIAMVSTRGESQWVKNIRANPMVTLSAKGANRVFTASEVPPGSHSEILSAYRAKAGKTVDSYFAELPDPVDHPVFKLIP